MADMAGGSWAPADIRFAIACVGLIGTFAGLLMLQTLASEGP